MRERPLAAGISSSATVIAGNTARVVTGFVHAGFFYVVVPLLLGAVLA